MFHIQYLFQKKKKMREKVAQSRVINEQWNRLVKKIMRVLPFRKIFKSISPT